jgi:hypothetical protein
MIQTIGEEITMKIKIEERERKICYTITRL